MNGGKNIFLSASKCSSSRDLGFSGLKLITGLIPVLGLICVYLSAIWPRLSSGYELGGCSQVSEIKHKRLLLTGQYRKWNLKKQFSCACACACIYEYMWMCVCVHREARCWSGCLVYGVCVRGCSVCMHVETEIHIQSISPLSNSVRQIYQFS